MELPARTATCHPLGDLTYARVTAFELLLGEIPKGMTSRCGLFWLNSLYPSSLYPSSLYPSSLIPHPSSLIPHPSSLIPHPSIHQPINPSTHQPLNPSIHQPINWKSNNSAVSLWNIRGTLLFRFIVPVEKGLHNGRKSFFFYVHSVLVYVSSTWLKS